MAGVGKSFTAKHMAELLGYEYVEVDEHITREAGEIVGKDSLPDDVFVALEESVILSLANKSKSVIDTGGSVVYSQKAMDLLREISFVVCLSDAPDNIRKRFDARGEFHLVGMAPGTNFEDLFAKRRVLYEKYADIEVDVSHYSDMKNRLAYIVDMYNQNT